MKDEPVRLCVEALELCDSDSQSYKVIVVCFRIAEFIEDD